jgi:hypothetical protein
VSTDQPADAGRQYVTTDQPAVPPGYNCPGGHECPGYTDDDIADAHERGVAEGRRQATEGWEREWAFEHRYGRTTYDTETNARMAAAEQGRTVVSRLAGPWEPAEQPDAFAETQRAAAADVARAMGRPVEDYADEQPEGGAR